MALFDIRCPECNSDNKKPHTTYTVIGGEERKIYRGEECGSYFSETKNTPIERLRRPLSFIILVINAVNEGMGFKAAARTFGTTRKSINRWLERLGGLKETLLLYAINFSLKLLKVTNCILKSVRISLP
jgi:transposase-like protein